MKTRISFKCINGHPASTEALALGVSWKFKCRECGTVYLRLEPCQVHEVEEAKP